MKLRATSSFIFAAGLAIVAVAGDASAACTRLGFSVNDYGKDGPTKDAKDLLDKYVAKWAAERGIKKYTIGKKDVTCELYLNLIVVDEHTCRAEAPVCWEGKGVPNVVATGKAAPAEGVKAKPAAAKAVKTSAPASTGSIPAAPTAAIPAPVAPATAAVPAAAAPVVEAPKVQ